MSGIKISEVPHKVLIISTASETASAIIISRGVERAPAKKLIKHICQVQNAKLPYLIIRDRIGVSLIKGISDEVELVHHSLPFCLRRTMTVMILRKSPTPPAM